MASVVGLFVSPAVGERMQARTAVRALAGQGLEGDRYALGQGSYSRVARQVVRHVSLIAREAMEAANEELNQRGLAPFEPDETRRNIVVEGIDVYALLGRGFALVPCACAAPIPPGRAMFHRLRPARPALQRRITIAAGSSPRC